MRDLMIVAAGLGTRVSNITHNIIPKYLINIDHFNGLHHIINYWDKYVDNYYLVIHPFYYNITKYYLDHFHKDSNIKIITYEESDGTAFTIQKVLKDNPDYFKSYDNELIISWCDIFPDKQINIDFFEISSDICIFVNGDECRYKFNEELNRIESVGVSGGDIIGIYYFKNIECLFNTNIIKNKDIVEYLEEIGSISTYYLEKICDYGDEPKLYKLRDELKKTSINHRHFNELIIKNGNVMKRGINEQGRQIIANEINWYKYIKNLRVNNDFDIPIPQIRTLKNEYYIMEYLENYQSVAEYFNNKKTDEKEMTIDRIMDNIHFIHSIDEKKINEIEFKWDIMYEVVGKIRERLKDVRDIIQSVGTIELVNGVKINSIDNLMAKTIRIIEEYYEFNNISKTQRTYNIIHGDLNFSNIMIEKTTKRIKFIDPRGYFGKSKVYGCKEYDYAKILYGIYGYDNFQSTFDFQPTECKDRILNFNIPKIDVREEFLRKHFSKIHYAFLIVIWLGLAQYTKNNYWKCVCSYYYAFSLEYLLD